MYLINHPKYVCWGVAGRWGFVAIKWQFSICRIIAGRSSFRVFYFSPIIITRW